MRRRRVDAEKRSVRNEVALSNFSSMAIAKSLLTNNPSAEAKKKEAAERVRSAINDLSDNDREILLSVDVSLTSRPGPFSGRPRCGLLLPRRDRGSSYPGHPTRVA